MFTCLCTDQYLYQQYLPSIDLTEPGRPAPNVVAETIGGDTFRLREHRGEVIVVNVWAIWCAPNERRRMRK